MRNKRNVFSAALVLVLLAVLLIVPAFAEANVTEVATYDALTAALANGGQIKLTADIFYSNGYNDGKTLKIEAGKDVTLDLNGHTLGQTVVDNGASVAAIAVRAGAVLTVKDSSAEQTGKISACNTAIQLEGTLNLQSGTIAVDNPSAYDANPETGFSFGVWCYMRSDEAVGPVFNMTGGAIDIRDDLLTTHAGYNFANAVACGDGASGVLARYEKASISITAGTVDGTLVVGQGTAVTAPEEIAVYCIASDGYAVDAVAALVNTDGAKKMYATLQAALDAAQDGDTIEILKNQTLTAQHVIEKDITVNGNGFELSTATVQRLIWVKADVTIHDLTVTNTYSGGRCIETRVGGITLNLNDVTLTAANGSTQALTVGGNAGTDGDVVVNLNGCHIDSGAVGYGIITFNPVKLTIENSTAVCGYGALYLKPADSSVGSAGSVVEIKESTLSSLGRDDGYAFGTVIMQDHNITVNVDEKSALTAANPENSTGRQYAVMISSLDKAGNPAVYTGITVNVAGKLESSYLLSNLTSLENTVYIPAQYKDAIEAFTAYSYFTTDAGNGQIRVWAAHDHDLKKTDAVKETCTKDGNVEYYQCAICGKIFADAAAEKELTDVVIPAAHAFGDWMPKKEATCTQAGHADHFYCSACGLYKILSEDGETYVDATEKEAIIPASGHKVVYVEAKAATCTEDGWSEYWYCSVCSGEKIYADEALKMETALEKVLVPAGHNYTSRVDAKAPTCTEEGNVEYWACEHCKVVEIVTENGRVESTQDKTVISAKGHTMTKVETATPTCTEEGNVEYYKCSECKKNFADEKGEKELTTVVEAAKGHKLTKVEAKAATCTEDGVIAHYTCSVCKKNFADEKGEKELTTVVEAAKSHKLTKVEAKAATCTEDGVIAHYTCSGCKKNFADEKGEKELTSVAEAAKGHKLTKVEAKAATCTEDGVIAHYTCSGCKKNFADEKGEKELTSVAEAAKGHKLTKVEAKAATYTEAGNIEHYACACGKLFADEEGEKEITDVVIPQLIKVEEEKAEVSKDAVDNAIADAKEKAEATGKPVEVVIEVPKAPVVEEKPEDTDKPEQPEQKPQEVVKVELPVQALENVAKEEANLTVVMPSVTVTMDTNALQSVTEQAAGNTVTLVVEQVKEETLTEKQQEVVSKYDVAVTIKAEFICQETQEKIWTENSNADKEQSGSVTVKMPFTPPQGTKGTDYQVLYIADDGSVKEIRTAFEDGHLVFALEHFSEYVVVNTASINDIPKTDDPTMLDPFLLLLVLSFAGVAVLVAGKKELL